MHTLGRKMRVDASNDAGPTCLVDVDRWDFHWQNLWWYEQPIHLDSPRSISIRCEYDTTSRTDTVTWGENTTDEMCISYFYVVARPGPAVRLRRRRQSTLRIVHRHLPGRLLPAGPQRYLH